MDAQVYTDSAREALGRVIAALADGKPPEVRAALERLVAEGRFDAIEEVIAALDAGDPRPATADSAKE